MDSEILTPARDRYTDLVYLVDELRDLRDIVSVSEFSIQIRFKPDAATGANHHG